MTGHGAVPAESVARYLDLARAGDLPAARDLALRLLDRGTTPEAVLVDLLGAAQREVGRRWHRNEWSVADEHLVSGLTTRVLDAVVAGIPPLESRGHLLVVCAEGDWHSLPAQVVAEVLRLRGWETTCLGASTPARHVAAFLDRRPAVAVLVSCSLPLFFAGVRSVVEVAHARGVPVLAGGLALGPDRRRAAALGADAWALEPRDAAAVLDSWAVRPPSTLAVPPPVPSAYTVLETRAPELARLAMKRLEGRAPSVVRYDDVARSRTLEDLEYVVRYVAAANLVDDEPVLTELVPWLTELLEARGVPLAHVPAGLDAVCEVLDQVVPDDAATIARRCLAAH